MSDFLPNLRLDEVRRFQAIERKYYDLEGRIKQKLKWMLGTECDVVIDKEENCAHCYLLDVPDGIQIQLDQLVRIGTKEKLIEFWKHMRKISTFADLTEFSQDRIDDLTNKLEGEKDESES